MSIFGLLPAMVKQSKMISRIWTEESNQPRCCFTSGAIFKDFMSYRGSATSIHHRLLLVGFS